MLSENGYVTNNSLGLYPIFSWSPEVFRRPPEEQNEPLWVIDPMSLYLGDKTPNFDLELLEQAPGELSYLR